MPLSPFAILSKLTHFHIPAIHSSSSRHITSLGIMTPASTGQHLHQKSSRKVHLLKYIFKTFLSPPQYKELHLSKWKKSPLVLFVILIICLAYGKWRKYRDEKERAKTSRPPIDTLSLHQSQPMLTVTSSTDSSTAGAVVNHTAQSDTATQPQALSSLQSLLSAFRSYFSFFASIATDRDNLSRGSSLRRLQRQPSAPELISLNDMIRLIYAKMNDELYTDCDTVSRPEQPRAKVPLRMTFVSSSNPTSAAAGASDGTGASGSEDEQDGTRSPSSPPSLAAQRAQLSPEQLKRVQTLKQTMLTLYASTLLFIHCRLSFALVQSLTLFSKSNQSTAESTTSTGDGASSKNKRKKSTTVTTVSRQAEKKQLKVKILNLYQQRFLSHHFIRLKAEINGFFEENHSMIEEAFCLKNQISHEEVLEFILLFKEYMDTRLNSIMVIDEESAMKPATRAEELKSALQSQPKLAGESGPAANTRSQKASKKRVTFVEPVSMPACTAKDATLLRASPLKKPIISLAQSKEDHIQLYDETTQRPDFPAVLDECHLASVNRFVSQILSDAIVDETKMRESVTLDMLLKRMDEERQMCLFYSYIGGNKYLRILDRLQLSIFCCSV